MVQIATVPCHCLNLLLVKVIEKQRTGTGAIKRQIPLLTPILGHPKPKKMLIFRFVGIF